MKYFQMYVSGPLTFYKKNIAVVQLIHMYCMCSSVVRLTVIRLTRRRHHVMENCG